ncbi:MAG: PadR family transcriptional regulator [Chloroflexi bacterium]|nr:PadR family transcriptional regulator [Chloroflexota bacterium]MCI0890880.1 PadR family transcriptional regulator [Chloroflexota bacterium]
MTGNRDLTEKSYWQTLASRGTGRFLVLAALNERPRHGYELARAVTEACDGCCEPTDAMIYPTIRELTEGGYITCRTESQGQRQRKVCQLTDRGRAAFRAAAEVWTSVLPALQNGVDAGMKLDTLEAKEEVLV